jgi:hypothetical protein
VLMRLRRGVRRTLDSARRGAHPPAPPGLAAWRAEGELRGRRMEGGEPDPPLWGGRKETGSPQGVVPAARPSDSRVRRAATRGASVQYDRGAPSTRSAMATPTPRQPSRRNGKMDEDDRSRLEYRSADTRHVPDRLWPWVLAAVAIILFWPAWQFVFWFLRQMNEHRD